jgi:hypothetical protein
VGAELEEQTDAEWRDEASQSNRKTAKNSGKKQDSGDQTHQGPD